jgi:flagellar biosynthesis protein FlhF
MIARNYRSSNVRDALAQARQELGPTALVHGTRLVPATGWRGWLGLREVELSASAPTVVSENRRSSTVPPVVQPRPRPIADGLVARLVATGLDQDLAEAVVDELPVSARRDPTQGQIRKALALCVAPVARARDVAGPVEVFVGPPGVGKTTTIAKIAAQARARGGNRFRLVAADGYRVGAVEQLRLYAEIIGSPFVVTRTPEEVVAAVDASRLPVLVDTPGLSPANEEAARFFAALLGMPGVTTHLVVPATTTPRDFDRIWNRFEGVAPACVTITKVDEAESLMPLVRCLRARTLRISLLGLGQQVPDDLAAATAETVAACLLGQTTRTAE